MVTLFLPGKTHPNSPCIGVALLVCFLSVFFIFIPVTHAKFSNPAPRCATLFSYDTVCNVLTGRSDAVGAVRISGSLKSSIQVPGYDRIARFPYHRHDHKILETLTTWALQPFFYLLRNLKILYASLLILLVFYLIYINVPHGSRLFRNKY
jgi:hypothetical protein